MGNIKNVTEEKGPCGRANREAKGEQSKDYAGKSHYRVFKQTGDKPGTLSRFFIARSVNALVKRHPEWKDVPAAVVDRNRRLGHGIEAVQELRRNGYRSPIVALTANSTVEDRNACLWAGCNDFLTKPVDRSKFVAVLGNYLCPAEPEEPDTLPPVCSVLLTDEPEASDLVLQFIDKIPATLSEINEAAANRDWDKLKCCVHRLKGVGGGYGYPELTEIAGKIEFQIENRNQSEIDSLLHQLGTYADRIVAGKAFVSTLSGNNATGT